ncbi:unnamed protein product [Paramecium primaurelia]|uniref:Large ribosomal subunit protein uL15/eL18 domain-containing protein n=1 Tax=Paramecium primaurelia TaxID=5886 RepID=A0A8S1QEB3_PARPR|nr:unnamed protein product [Paramecium primaurelia]
MFYLFNHLESGIISKQALVPKQSHKKKTTGQNLLSKSRWPSQNVQGLRPCQFDSISMQRSLSFCCFSGSQFIGSTLLKELDNPSSSLSITYQILLPVLVITILFPLLISEYINYLWKNPILSLQQVQIFLELYRCSLTHRYFLKKRSQSFQEQRIFQNVPKFTLQHLNNQNFGQWRQKFTLKVQSLDIQIASDVFLEVNNHSQFYLEQSPSLYQVLITDVKQLTCLYQIIERLQVQDARIYCLISITYSPIFVLNLNLHDSYDKLSYYVIDKLSLCKLNQCLSQVRKYYVCLKFDDYKLVLVSKEQDAYWLYQFYHYNKRKQVISTNLYLKLLIKLYKFLARRTDSQFNVTILRRLQSTRTARYPISVSRLVKQINTAKDKTRTLVVVGTVTDDARLLTVPKLNVCALRFTETARKRILAAGGKTLTFDQLAQQNPTGTGTILLRGPKVREALKHFGRAAGLPGSHAKPYVSHTARRGKGAR